MALSISGTSSGTGIVNKPVDQGGTVVDLLGASDNVAANSLQPSAANAGIVNWHQQVNQFVGIMAADAQIAPHAAAKRIQDICQQLRTQTQN